MAAISTCTVDPARLEPFREAMETYGIEIEDGIDLEAEEWALTCISPFAIAYSCGAIARRGATIEHRHEPAELERCVLLSTKAVSLTEGLAIVPSKGKDYFMPFFIAANERAAVPLHLTDELVRKFFGGTINPAAQITIEPLQDTSRWWREMRAFYSDYDIADEEDRQVMDRIFGRWRAMLQWFNTHAEFHGCAYISIGLGRDSNYIGTVLPRLVVGLTRAGSVVGVCGCAVV